MIRKVPFGYITENGKNEIVSEEASVVKEIFCLYSSGETLKSIADSLNGKDVTYSPNSPVWNKNMVSRILMDTRYLGDDKFPGIVGAEQFQKALQIRDEKSAKKTELPELTEIIKSKLKCGQCGKPFRRINKWKSREKWLCTGKCGFTKYVDDKLIFNGVLRIINKVIASPGLLTASPDTSAYQPTTEIIRRTNDIYRMMEQPKAEFKEIASLILETASDKYDCCSLSCGSDVSDSLSAMLSGIGEQNKLNVGIIKAAVDSIRISKEGNISVLFCNHVEMSDDEGGNKS